MSVPLYEAAYAAGRPFHLYWFIRNSGLTVQQWVYNTTDRDMTYAGITYKSLPISNDGVKLTGEAVTSELNITLPATSEFCNDYRLGGSVPSDAIYCRIFMGHEGDVTTDVAGSVTLGQATLYWIGTVDGMSQTGDIEVQLKCSMLPASFQRSGLRYGWVQNCPHMLYEPLTCKVDKTLFVATVWCTGVSGVDITGVEFTLFEDGWFDGGYIEYALPSGVTERRTILRHLGGNVRLLGVPPGLEAGMYMYCYAGCDRTVEDCTNKFGNYLNFGGFEFIPGRNPFDGNPVF